MSDAQGIDHPELLTIEELSRILKIPTGSIRNQLCRGKFSIKPLKIGRLLRFKADDTKDIWHLLTV